MARSGPCPAPSVGLASVAVDFARRSLILAIAVALVTSGCGGGATQTVTATSASKRADWAVLAHAARPLDLAGPRHDGTLVVAVGRRLALLGRNGRVRSFASEYVSVGGAEPYIALSPGGCFGQDTVYALQLRSPKGVLAVTPSGTRLFARVGGSGLLDGIAFDQVGRFGHDLLVTRTAAAKTTVLAIDCHGRVRTVTRSAPRMEGGIAVAPLTFGRFGGDLIAPDEHSGRIFAVTSRGSSLLVANSGLPRGGDVGVESEAFAPSGSWAAFVADRRTPGNPHPGDDAILRIQGTALMAAGVRAGDLLVAIEGGALTESVTCTKAGCRTRLVAQGPTAAHVEGHLVVASSFSR
jgi:hypothetical protein